MRNNGETNPVTIVVVVLLAVLGFFAFHIVPLYMDNMECSEAAAEAFNIFFNDGEETAYTKLLVRLNDKNPSANHYETNEDGVEVQLPGLGLTEDNVSFTFDEKAKHLDVKIEYDRVVQFSPLEMRKTFHFVATKSGAQTK